MHIPCQFGRCIHLLEIIGNLRQGGNVDQGILTLPQTGREDISEEIQGDMGLHRKLTGAILPQASNA
jgi:hypothetical protein